MTEKDKHTVPLTFGPFALEDQVIADHLRHWSIAEVVKVSGVGRTTIYAEISAGRLRCVKIGRRTLVPNHLLIQWLAHLPDGTFSKRTWHLGRLNHVSPQEKNSGDSK